MSQGPRARGVAGANRYHGGKIHIARACPYIVYACMHPFDVVVTKVSAFFCVDAHVWHAYRKPFVGFLKRG